MTKELREKMARLNAAARDARKHGYETEAGYVITAEEGRSFAARKVCTVEEWAEKTEAAR